MAAIPDFSPVTDLHRARTRRGRSGPGQAEAELNRVLAAVARHRDDDTPGADARLYGEVLGMELPIDVRVDDPNDWPDP